VLSPLATDFHRQKSTIRAGAWAFTAAKRVPEERGHFTRPAIRKTPHGRRVFCYRFLTASCSGGARETTLRPAHQMKSMTIGLYNAPKGAYLPSVLY
jgi:hypothetical protein